MGFRGGVLQIAFRNHVVGEPMNFRIARAAGKTGRLLERLVDQQYPFHERPNAIVCYGQGYSGPLPALNRNCNRLNKLEQAQRLVEGLGAQAVPVMDYEQALVTVEQWPVLGRKVQHAQGRDIVPLLERWMVEGTQGQHDFYTPYIHSATEYRTWIYRNRHLGTYMKVLTYPEKFKRIGRNHKNGFTFMRMANDDVHPGIKELAKKAVRSLDLDFGGVDIINADDGVGNDEPSFMVLEVNSAPGVNDERRQVIKALAHRVIRWAAAGCPERQDG
jgi:RimK-like ATP-grasp domain